MNRFGLLLFLLLALALPLAASALVTQSGGDREDRPGDR
jgi:hypothetical protein